MSDKPTYLTNKTDAAMSDRFLSNWRPPSHFQSGEAQKARGPRNKLQSAINARTPVAATPAHTAKNAAKGPSNG